MNAMRWAGAQLLDQQLDESNATKIAPGKRTMSERLPVQRRVAAGTVAPPAAASSEGHEAFDDPFSMHLSDSGDSGNSGDSGGSGAPLPDGVRTQMEASFGASFASVRVSEGAAAEQLGAEAFASGEHVQFAPGRMDFSSRGGLELLGHELAHVVQQREGRVSVPQGKGGAINADPSLEAEADRAGALAASGLSVGGGGGSALAAAPSGGALQLKRKNNSKRIARNKQRRKAKSKQRAIDYQDSRGEGREIAPDSGSDETESSSSSSSEDSADDGGGEDAPMRSVNPFAVLETVDDEELHQQQEEEHQRQLEARRKNREAQLHRNEEKRRLEQEAKQQREAEREREIAERLLQLEQERLQLEEEQEKIEEKKRLEEQKRQEEQLEKEENERRRKEEEERKREEQERLAREEEQRKREEEERRNRKITIPKGSLLTATIMSSPQGFLMKGTVLKSDLEMPGDSVLSFLFPDDPLLVSTILSPLAGKSYDLCSAVIDEQLTAQQICAYVPTASGEDLFTIVNHTSEQMLGACMTPTTAVFLCPQIEYDEVIELCLNHEKTFILPHCQVQILEGFIQKHDQSWWARMTPHLSDVQLVALLPTCANALVPYMKPEGFVFCMQSGHKELLLQHFGSHQQQHGHGIQQMRRIRALSCCELLTCTGKVLDPFSLKKKEQEIAGGQKLAANLQEIELLLEAAMQGDVICVQIGLLASSTLKKELTRFGLEKLVEKTVSKISYGGDGVVWRQSGPTVLQAKGNSSSTPLESQDWTTHEGERKSDTVPFRDQLLAAARQLAGLVAWGDNQGLENPLPGGQGVACLQLTGISQPVDLQPFLTAAQQTLQDPVSKSTRYLLGPGWKHVREIWIDWADGSRTILCSNGKGGYEVQQ